ncbi:TadE/TadG family type IV pilus assembly protein [Sagittula salina]|uniref:Pilus assembly protein n=1 Tax=Sagittula salina TaxID=2820268 RepID=A0A940MSW2_9RHOB|nr:TadE/TadG family type IV pilus assembly protein [Sagittula salina]MBP0484058.1 pilus assembly protein [Sagittula salina]
MMSSIRSLVTRFRREEDGSAAVEFALYFTLFFFILTAGWEVAYMNLRHAMLERAVDLSVRDIRLSTGAVPSYTEIRTRICEDAAILSDCGSNLMLEMVEVDPRNFWTIDPNPDCRNAEEEPRPVRHFNAGQDNALMLIRACLKYKPMMPTTGIGKELNKDSEGYAQMIVTSAFVQEPR